MHLLRVVGVLIGAGALAGCGARKGDRGPTPSPSATAAAAAATLTPPPAPVAVVEAGPEAQDAPAIPSASPAERLAATREVGRARAELIAAGHSLARQKDLTARGEPMSGQEYAQRDYDRAARELRQAEERLKRLRSP